MAVRAEGKSEFKGNKQIKRRKNRRFTFLTLEMIAFLKSDSEN